MTYFWSEGTQQCRHQVTNANGCVGTCGPITEQQRQVPWQPPGCVQLRTRVLLGDGAVRSFNLTESTTWVAVNHEDTLQPVAGGTLYTRAEDGI